jgi:hypothetical protein
MRLALGARGSLSPCEGALDNGFWFQGDRWIMEDARSGPARIARLKGAEMGERNWVTDDPVSRPSERFERGKDEDLRSGGDGQGDVAHGMRREDDGSRNVLILEDGYTALQRFCHEVAPMMGHRPEYTLALSALVVWSLEAERRSQSQTLVQQYGEALYRGEQPGRREGARFIRLFGDAMNALQQFAADMAEVLGGMNAERTIVLTALTAWAVEQEEALDVVDEYAVRLYTRRREARQQAREKKQGKEYEEGQSYGVVDDV